MEKFIIRFSFPGNITWGTTAKNDWAPTLLDYVESELAIGNGTFISIEPSSEINAGENPAPADSLKDIIVAEIICDMPKAIVNDEFAIRARLITLLEDRKFDFIKFHNCGPDSNMSLGTDHSMTSETFQ